MTSSIRQPIIRNAIHTLKSGSGIDPDVKSNLGEALTQAVDTRGSYIKEPGVFSKARTRV